MSGLTERNDVWRPGTGRVSSAFGANFRKLVQGIAGSCR